MLVALLLAQAAIAPPRVVEVTAERFRFTPATIELRVGEAVVIEPRSLDRKHGFAVPDLGIDVTPQQFSTSRSARLIGYSASIPAPFRAFRRNSRCVLLWS